MKRNVCHISTVHPQNDVRIFYRECQSLVQAGYEVHLLIDSATEGMIDGVYVHRLLKPKSRLVRMVFSPWRALCKALKIKADIYHYHDPELFFMGFILRWVFRKNVVYDIHESVPRQIMGKEWLPSFCRKAVAISYKLIERVFLVGQSSILANENSVKDYSAKSYLVRNYPKIDEALLADLQEIRPSDKLRLVYLGGVAKVRGALIYIELAKNLKQRGYDFEMYLIGQYTEALKQQMDELISEYDLAKIVNVTGRMEYNKALKLVATSHIGLCLLEPIPNYLSCLATKILEYMMLGLPVLASDFDCWRKYVEGQESGAMVNPMDSEAVVEACEKMLSNPQLRQEMSENGRKAVKEKYNWQTELKELLRCYDNLLADKM